MELFWELYLIENYLVLFLVPLFYLRKRLNLHKFQKLIKVKLNKATKKCLKALDFFVIDQACLFRFLFWSKWDDGREDVLLKPSETV